MATKFTLEDAASVAGVRPDSTSRSMAPQSTGKKAGSGTFSLEDAASLTNGSAGSGGGGFDMRGAVLGTEEFVGAMAKDLMEGAVAPVVAGMETAKGLLADPSIGLLPSDDQAGHFQEAGRQAIKGAAFWGSAFVGGKVAGLALKPLWKAASSGAASAGMFQMINDLPAYLTGEEDSGKYAGNIAAATTLGAFTGGVLAATPGASKGAIRMANTAIEAIPGAARVRTQVSEHLKSTYNTVSNSMFTSGKEALRKLGVEEVGKSLEAARNSGAMLGGRLVAGFYKTVNSLNDDEASLVGSLMDTVDFRLDTKLGAMVLQKSKEHAKGSFAPDLTDQQFNKVWDVAREEAKRLRFVGELFKKVGLRTYDPVNDEYHTFVLRDSYLPHRFTNPNLYRVGGAYRAESLANILKERPTWSHERAGVWLDNFANNLEGEIGDVVQAVSSGGTTSGLSGTAFLRARSFNLPGFETDVRKILPTYYEHAAKRIINHTFFAELDAAEQAVKKTVNSSLFTREEWNAMQTHTITPEGIPITKAASEAMDSQMVMQEIMDAAEGTVGMRHDLPQTQTARTTQEILAQRRAFSFKEWTQGQAVEKRYGRAFVPLEGITDPEQKKLAENIVRRQLSGIESPAYGDKMLQNLAKLEVITKLALGAIAQPSQMMSAVMRTGFKGSVKSLFLVLKNDPEALDFAIRSGILLKGVVRKSEQSLEGVTGDFLSKVYFTQFDMKSRLYGAVQGRAFAQHVAMDFAETAQRLETARTAGNERLIKTFTKRLGLLEEKLMGVGVNTQTLVRRGGILSKKELLGAAQQVSGDVNFWGDSLSLPEFFRSPYGRYVTQFKSFGFQQSKLIKDHLVKPAMRGDWGPMMRFAAIMPLGGEMIADLKQIARGKNKRFQNLENPPIDAMIGRFFENIANAAGFGLIADAFEATSYGTSGALGFIAGPMGTTAGKAFSATGELLRGKPKKAMRFAIETGIPAAAAIAAPGVLPIVATLAPAASNLLMPKRQSGGN